MTEPAQLRAVDAEPVEDVVRELEALLEQARKGEIRAIAVAALLTGNEILSLSTRSDNLFGLVGALEYAKQRLLTREE